MGVEYGGVRVQGMCPHELYLGTCTCIFFLKNQAKCYLGKRHSGLKF